MTGIEKQQLRKASGAARRTLALLVGLLVAVLISAVGAGPAAAETRVGASHSASILLVGPPPSIAAGHVGVHTVPRQDIASATCVAAKGVSGLAPKLDKAFQFGSGGRSGAGVKNFVGPQNAVVRGASPGRVFVTDGQGRVILDVTRDRVKPVVPGQGFISGDGRKLAPTQQQLDWIDELWGGSR